MIPSPSCIAPTCRPSGKAQRSKLQKGIEFLKASNLNGGTFGKCPSNKNYAMQLSYKQISYCFLLLLLSLRPLAALAQRQKLKTDVKEIVLENRFLSRKFALDLGWLRTSYFANLQT